MAEQDGASMCLSSTTPFMSGLDLQKIIHSKDAFLIVVDTRTGVILHVSASTRTALSFFKCQMEGKGCQAFLNKNHSSTNEFLRICKESVLSMEISHRVEFCLQMRTGRVPVVTEMKAHEESLVPVGSRFYAPVHMYGRIQYFSDKFKGQRSAAKDMYRPPDGNPCLVAIGQRMLCSGQTLHTHRPSVSNANSFVLEITRAGHFVSCNRDVLFPVIGYLPRELIQEDTGFVKFHPTIYEFIHIDDVEWVNNCMDNIFGRRVDSERMLFRMRHKPTEGDKHKADHYVLLDVTMYGKHDEQFHFYVFCMYVNRVFGETRVMESGSQNKHGSTSSETASKLIVETNRAGGHVDSTGVTKVCSVIPHRERSINNLVLQDSLQDWAPPPEHVCCYFSIRNVTPSKPKRENNIRIVSDPPWSDFSESEATAAKCKHESPRDKCERCLSGFSKQGKTNEHSITEIIFQLPPIFPIHHTGNPVGGLICTSDAIEAEGNVPHPYILTPRFFKLTLSQDGVIKESIGDFKDMVECPHLIIKDDTYMDLYIHSHDRIYVKDSLARLYDCRLKHTTLSFDLLSTDYSAIPVKMLAVATPDPCDGTINVVCHFSLIPEDEGQISISV